MLTSPLRGTSPKAKLYKNHTTVIEKIIIYYMPFSEFLGKSREQLDLLDSFKKTKNKKGSEKEIPLCLYFKCCPHPPQQ